MFDEHSRPRAHLVADDFFSPDALAAIFRDLPALERKMKPGLVRDVGHDGQSVFFAHRRRKNRAVWIHDPSRVLRLFREHLWSEEMVAAFDRAREPLFQIVPACWAPHLQVSRYVTGDHYDFHEDEGAGVNLTAVVFLATDPRRVHGGDLVLAHDGAEARIRFRHNRLVVFPSRTLHRVTRVRIDGGDPRDARISLQCWLTHGRPAERPKARPPEADRPTFLLAEEPILAAAQALGEASRRDQTPEDLYWGAFYLSRILASNLRCLIESEMELALGRVRIRRGAELEVYARGKLRGEPVRVGFVLKPPGTPPAKALALFVERRGSAPSFERAALPPGAGEEETVEVFHALLAAHGPRPRPAGARAHPRQARSRALE